jgi:hypothetical protein
MSNGDPNFYEKVLSKKELNFWIPIIISLIAVVMSFMALSAKVDLLSQKQDIIIAKLDEHIVENKIIQDTVAKNSNRLTALETIISRR